MPFATTRTHCRICPSYQGEANRIDRKATPRNTTLTPILDLGSTPLADKFVTDPDDHEETAPLTVGFCRFCSGVQLMDIVRDDVLFGNDYAFYTGASPSSIPYFKQYAQDILERYPEDCKGLIVEVASNDGTLLKHFQDAGREVLGIEPTANTAQAAIESGVPTLIEPMRLDLAMNWKNKQASLLIGNNVLAHVENLHDFVSGCSFILAEDGLMIFEVQYLPHLLFNNAFDHVYHEHRSFFSLTALTALFRLSQFTIVDVEEADTQGGSIRVFLRRDPYKTLESSMRVTMMLKHEQYLGLGKLETYQGFQAHVDYTRTKLVKLLTDLKQQGKTIYGYGASAKGNTLLNTCGIGPELLDCIVDLTPYKVGKYSPGMHIPVKHPKDVAPPDYYLVLVWNYLPGILKREQAYRDAGGRFIVPIPSPIII